MNPYVADPHWKGYIVWYFFLGGIAAGSYAMASLAALLGNEEDRRASRSAYYLAFPLVCLCGILLIIDLGRPERFSHMLIQTNTWRPMFKWYSPMSIGSWGLSVFGAFSFASFLGVLAEDRRLGLGRWSSLAMRFGRGWVGTIFQIGGTLSGFFLGGYTGALLSATNQPVWADTTWLGALFLASAASTGIAAILLLAPLIGDRPDSNSLHRFSRLDHFAMVLEMVLIGIVMLSLRGSWGGIYLRWPGVLIPSVVVPLGLVLPLILSRFRFRHDLVAILVLVGGFLLRYSVVEMPLPWLVAVQS